MYPFLSKEIGFWVHVFLFWFLNFIRILLASFVKNLIQIDVVIIKWFYAKGNIKTDNGICLCCLLLLGWGTNEKAIISILGHRNAAQRKQIRLAYSELFQEDLVKRLESELNGDFEVIVSIMVMITQTLCLYQSYLSEAGHIC